jgi:hypothetical protein
MSDFTEQFGLSYLGGRRVSKPASYSAAETVLPSGTQDVLDSYREKYVAVFKAAPDQTMSLFGLAQTTSSRLEVVLPIVQYLSGKGVLERVKEDPVGNDTYKLNSAAI